MWYKVWLPVSLSLLQNQRTPINYIIIVWLPVSLSLLQNIITTFPIDVLFDYQSVCHCSKTASPLRCSQPSFDYQSVCHCSKTGEPAECSPRRFDYQSVCHCSKTSRPPCQARCGLTTSQFVTAPKQQGVILWQVSVWLPVSLSLLQN